MVICLFNFIRNSWTALQIRTIFSFHRQNLKVLGIPHPICRTDYRTAWVACFREDYLCKVPMCWPVRRVCVCVCVCVCACTHAQSLSCVWLFAIPWMVVCQAPPSIRFSRQESWSGLPFPCPGDLPDQGLHPRLLHLRHRQADSLPLHHLESPLPSGPEFFFLKITLHFTLLNNIVR